MCTAITFKGINNYFGRNLDYEHLYDEKIAITPRNYELNYKKIEKDVSHFAFIGMATVINNYPLYYDGINEYGRANCLLMKHSRNGNKLTEH